MNFVDSVDGLLELDERLHGYQMRAVQHLWENPRAGLFLEMGLGKTATVLQALTPEHLPALVVGPKRVAEHVWPAEVKKWRPDLSIAVAAGNPEKRRAALNAKADITAIGVANLKDVRPGHKTIVLDELSLFKNSSSNRWHQAKHLTRFAEHVWGLTGTPTPNGLIDLWAQMYLLDQGEALGHGKRWGTGITQYRERWFVKGEDGFRWFPRTGAQEEIQSRISKVCISMRSEDYLELPAITYNTVTVPMSTKTAAVYEDMREKLVARFERDDITAANAAVLVGKLSQVTSGVMYHEDGTEEKVHSEKTDAVVEIVEGTGSPVLVFHRFKSERAALKKALPQARTVDEKGVLDDWNAGKVPVLLAHPASAGHGLNLAQGGHTIVWSTLDFSSELWEQANARLHRQGQKNPVIVHVLETPGTVDVEIAAALAGKIDTQDAVMAALKA